MEIVNGIIVNSSSYKAGKTVIISGLCGSILQEGMIVDPVKPLEYGEPGKDISFFSMITKKPTFYNTILLDSWLDTTNTSWRQLLNICKTFTGPVIMEAPGTVATPLRSAQSLLDCTDLSKELNWPLLLIIDNNHNLYEEAVKSISFLKYKECNIIGFIITCTTEDEPSHDLESIANTIALNYTTPCLGIYPFSPSIDVDKLMQGNVIKLTQKYIDILPVQKSLNLTIA